MMVPPSGDDLEPGQYVRVLPTDPNPHHRSYFLAVLRCPGCKRLAAMSKANHAVAPDGACTPSFVCPHDGCSFHEFITLDFWST